MEKLAKLKEKNLRKSAIQDVEDIPPPLKYKKKVTIVTYGEVREIGEEINYKLQAQEIEWSSIEEEYFSDLDQAQSIEQLQDVLESAPFYLTNPTQNELVCRYLCEDN